VVTHVLLQDMAHPQIKQFLRWIQNEEQAARDRFKLDDTHSLKAMKAEGLALHPLIITHRSYGYADYPEFSFKLPYPAETRYFRDGAPITCFQANEEPIKGVLLRIAGNQGECRLIASDFPDWLEDGKTAIKLESDEHTSTVMKQAMDRIDKNPRLLKLFTAIHDKTLLSNTTEYNQQPPHLPSSHRSLNLSQLQAVQAIIQNEELLALHGPPGTGKTTTLVAGIQALVELGQRVLVAAPSNAAVDHITRQLAKAGLHVIRAGHSHKVEEDLQPFTIEGKLRDGKLPQTIKKLKIQAEQYRKMALQYKRQFGPEERAQRQRLLQEVKQIRSSIRQMEQEAEQALWKDADVITGTPVGLYDADLREQKIDTLVIDEAGQCLEPLAWCLFPLAQRYVLAGDPFQLPPTLLSEQAAREGYNRSILENAMAAGCETILLDTQYRMPPSICGFSAQWFYDGKLKSFKPVNTNSKTLRFIDTAGTGFEESSNSEGASWKNDGELQLIESIIATHQLHSDRIVLITPYAGQATAARERFPQLQRISTIDSFQGQEAPIVIVSLVRSNDTQTIGFLQDYRRMNVALTRAQEQLIVIGDSATLGQDKFYAAFIQYVEQLQAYESAWEYPLSP